MAGDDELHVTQWVAVGVLLLVVLLVPAAVGLAAWAKRRYARAVVRLQAAMARDEGALPALAPVVGHTKSASAERKLTTLESDVVPAQAQAKALEVEVVPAQSLLRRGATAGDPTRAARRLRRRVLATQFVAGSLYWWTLLLCAAVALLWWQQLDASPAPASDDGGGGGWAGHLVLWPLAFLPPLFGWAFQAGLPERRVWAVAGAVALGFAAGLAWLADGWVAGAAIGAVLALVAALLAAFLRPAVRGAGPPLVAALTVALLAFSVGVAILVAFDDSADDTPITALDWSLAGVALLLLLAGAAWLARRLLLRLARRYADKRFSEMQLALGAYWGVLTAFTAAGVLMLSFDERTGASMEWVALVVVLVWGVWRVLQRVALWWARRGAPPALGALLMLRVFKPSDRSEVFTDRFLARWRFAAPVWMIAGADLAGAYMEPDEFFAFLGRRLHEHFIADATEVDVRVRSLDVARDPDARFRVSELFCSNSTWKATVLALMDRAGVVLLDLREYTPERAGTRFELEALLARVPLQRIVVIVDARDDLAPLREQIGAIWRRVAPGAAAPGVPGTAAPRLLLVQVGEGSGAEMRGLFTATAAAAAVPALR